MPPDVAEKYRLMVNNIHDVIIRKPKEAREALGELLGEVELTKDDDGSVWAHVQEFGDVLLKVVAGGRLQIKKQHKFKRFRVA